MGIWSPIQCGNYFEVRLVKWFHSRASGYTSVPSCANYESVWCIWVLMLLTLQMRESKACMCENLGSM